MEYSGFLVDFRFHFSSERENRIFGLKLNVYCDMLSDFDSVFASDATVYCLS